MRPELPDWTLQAACTGHWDEFDDGQNVTAAVVCWEACPVRGECLSDAIRSERKDHRIFGELSVHGIRGGYTVMERRLVHRMVEDSGFDILESV